MCEFRHLAGLIMPELRAGPPKMVTFFVPKSRQHAAAHAKGVLSASDLEIISRKLEMNK